MPFFRKKSPTIEAVRWTGKNLAEVQAFARGCFVAVDLDEPWGSRNDPALYVTFPGGFTRARLGDWLVREPGREHVRGDPDAEFSKTYEPAPSQEKSP